MKPNSIYQIRSDGKHMICVSCISKEEGEKYCDENNKDFSHGICPKCVVVNVVPDGQVFPTAPFKPAAYLERHNIQTNEDLEKFLNGEL